MFDTPPVTEVAVAAVATAGLVAAALTDSRFRRDLMLGWGTVIAVALVVLGHASAGVLVGVSVIWVASSWQTPVLTATRRQILVGLGLAIAVGTMVRDLEFVLVASAALTVLAAASPVWHFYQTNDAALGNVLVAATALGIYVNVPDTEQIAVVGAGLVVYAGATLVFSPLRTADNRLAAIAMMLAIVIAAGAIGSRGRPTAFIGVVGALGVLVAEPLAALVRRRSRAFPVVLLLVHGAVVIVASRVAGPLDSARDAFAITAAALAGAVVVLLVVPRRRRTATTTPT